MNAIQRKYLVDRVTQIKKVKIQQAKTECTSGHQMTEAEKLEALRQGDFVVVTPAPGTYRFLDAAIKFNSEVEIVLDAEKFKEMTAKLEMEATDVIDSLMLSSDAQAYEMLKAFEKGN